MLTRDRKSTVAQIMHPTTGICPLDMLVFRIDEWNRRVIFYAS